MRGIEVPVNLNDKLALVAELRGRVALRKGLGFPFDEVFGRFSINSRRRSPVSLDPLRRTRPAMERILGVCGVLSISVAVLAQVPAFRASVDLVTLNVRAVDGDGNLVGGLKREDFQVLEDGKLQTIATFDYAEFPLPSALSATAGSADARVEPVQVGRRYVLLMYDVRLRARDWLRRFVTRYVTPSDRVMLIFPTDSRPVEFTDDRPAILHAIANYRIPQRGRRPAPRPTTAILTIADQLRSVPGHKILLLIGSGMGCTFMTASTLASSQQRMNATGVDDGNDCVRAVKGATRAAVRADVTVYPVDPSGLLAPTFNAAERSTGSANVRGAAMPDIVNTWRLDPLRAIADDTGGFPIVNTNNHEDGFARLVRENSAYYVLGYYSTNELHDGAFRKNEVRINRRGVELQYRRGYFSFEAR
jgi:VWFA-related protein